ncbi:MAG: ribosomal RNA small subunit methyltransferase A [Candidatus Wildermuthbacteria bacterium]|nr:ribosomal RNA small subunit methyltransferase A [Candidatus Wildermuthbacteria bacterium]
MDTAEIKKLLQDQKIRPRKGLGQNFLVAKPILQKIIAASSLKNGDTVLEVGPGLGILTKALAEKAKKVVAVEKDHQLVELLEGLTVGMKNIEIIHGDILTLQHSNIPSLQHSYKLVANLPYYITSPVIRMFLEAKVQPRVMVLMVQKEVAQRICAKPPRMNLLAVSVQAYAKPEIVSIVPKNAFWPQPKVDSAILKLTPYPTMRKIYDRRDFTRWFFAVVRAGFKQPRKQLGGNLAKGLSKVRPCSKEDMVETLSQLGINPAARAETLSIEDWLKLAKLLSKK